MSFTLNTAPIPGNLDVKNTLMRRTEGFDHRIPRSRASRSLEALLKHSLVIRLRRAQRIGAFQFIAQGVANKTRRRFETSVEKDGAGYRFKHVRQQSVLVTPATLLFAAPET